VQVQQQQQKMIIQRDTRAVAYLAHGWSQTLFSSSWYFDRSLEENDYLRTKKVCFNRLQHQAQQKIQIQKQSHDCMQQCQQLSLRSQN
jgi:hypothetical protein